MSLLEGDGARLQTLETAPYDLDPVVIQGKDFISLGEGVFL